MFVDADYVVSFPSLGEEVEVGEDGRDTERGGRLTAAFDAVAHIPFQGGGLRGAEPDGAALAAAFHRDRPLGRMW